jgi:ubiquinone biosynthesis protein COQ9
MTNPDASEALTKLAQSALNMAAETPWQELTLGDIGSACDVTLATCARLGISKADIAGQIDQNLDQAMLASQPKIDKTQGVRDRLFDVLMGRFDGMEENRAAWTSILASEKSDLVGQFARRARRARTGVWALEASGVTASDLRGAGRAIGIARVLRLVEKVWLDDGPDLAKTMARLDQELRKGEEWVERLQGLEGKLSSFKFSRPKASTDAQEAVPD